MEVLILSKTKYGNTQVCVGGICIGNKQFIRLLNQGGYYQPADTKFNIGDIWDITFTPVTHKREPHNEDVIIQTYSFLRKVYKLESYIKNMGVPIWVDNVTNIFEGKIRWTGNGKGYFSENINNYPSHSVGFWVSDVDLYYQNGYYLYENNGIKRQIIYKGNQDVSNTIPKGKLIRLSLAKWWKPEDSDIEARCYLQLSGWYEDKQEPPKAVVPKPVVKAEYSNKVVEVKPVLKVEHINNIVEVKPLLKIEQSLKVKPVIKSFELSQSPKQEPYKPIDSTKPKNISGPCYIATLCYKDYYADEVCTFRDFRDHSLNKTFLGKKFIATYYQLAPKLVQKLENKAVINLTIQYLILNPLLTIIKTFKLDK